MNTPIRLHPITIKEYKTELIPIKTACKLFNVSRVTIHQWIKKGKLPEPVKVTPQVFGWHPHIIEPFLPKEEAAKK